MTVRESVTSLTPSLRRIDTNSAIEHSIFYEHRVICGWKYNSVSQIFAQAAQEKRKLYWICIPSSSPSGVRVSKNGREILSESKLDAIAENGTVRTEDIHIPLLPAVSSDGVEQGIKGFLPVGHISIDFADLDSVTTPELGSGDGRVTSITTLFVLPCYRKYGLASWAMAEAERLIRQGYAMPEGGVPCERIALSTLAERHYVQPGRDGVGIWELKGYKSVEDAMSRGRAKYHGPWYRGMGYERRFEMRKFKEVSTDGEHFMMWAEIWDKEI